MASPQSSGSYEAASAPKKHEQITFRFCSECSNMLYPKEDADAHKLQFTCRTCQFTEDAQSTCVFRNDLNTSAGETAGVTQDVGSDPTVSEPLPVLCDFCGHVVYCSTCVQPASTLFVVKTSCEKKETIGMCQVTFPWGDEDPFDEYDEEMMADKDQCDLSEVYSDTTSCSESCTYDATQSEH